MNYYFYKLISPRPTFPGDMTPEEGKLMQQHVAYWSEQIKKGNTVLVGPVADPKGAYGVGILRLEEPNDLASLVANDPVILGNAGFTPEIYPMPKILLAEGT